MLHDVELVIHDPALRQPLLDALPERLPHVHTGRPDRAPLKGAQLLLEELVQRLLSSVPARTTTALERRNKQRQQQNQPHRCAAVDGVTPYQGSSD